MFYYIAPLPVPGARPAVGLNEREGTNYSSLQGCFGELPHFSFQESVFSNSKDNMFQDEIFPPGQSNHPFPLPWQKDASHAEGGVQAYAYISRRGLIKANHM